MCHRLNSHLRLVFQSLLLILLYPEHEIPMTTIVFTPRDRLSMYHQQLPQLTGHQPRCLRPPISAARRLLYHHHNQG
jgi:hypothetical protein